MRTVGIITMHRVLNCGSALQAYALQHKIEQLGFKSELIDYKYPNSYHKSIRRSNKSNFIVRLINDIYTFLNSLYLKSTFSHFYKCYFVLSSRYYKTRNEIKEHPPVYDVYVSGSDQVWNPRYIGKDTTFMLSFTSSDNKVSYASSLASHGFEKDIEDLFAKHLGKFKDVSVREEMSCEYVKRLCGKDCKFVLDPSMLLTPTEWAPILKHSKCKLSDKPYILIYVLGYSFNVYDYAADLINHVQKQTGWKVKVLIFSRYHRKLLNKYTAVNGVSPETFLQLIKNAALVITDSFHATAFSLNFSKPVFPLIKSRENIDNRVFSLLKSLGADDWAIERDQPFKELPPILKDYSSVEKNIVKLRKESIDYLLKALK